MALTGTPDIDFNILIYLTDDQLRAICATNKYTTNLCLQDNFWKQRIISYLDREYLDWKPDHLTWRQWYFFWRQHSHDPIGQQLHLNPYQAYIRLITQDDVMRGSEYFQTIDLNLAKAFTKGDIELITYFLIRLNELLQLTDENPHYKSLDYPLIITSALRSGFLKEAQDLLYLLSGDFDRLYAEGEEDESYYTQIVAKISHELGRLGLITFYHEILPKFLIGEWRFDQEEVNKDFIVGLIEGGFQEEVETELTKYLQVYPSNGSLYYFLFRSLIPPAFKTGNFELIQLLWDGIPPGENLTNFRKVYGQSALRYGYIEMALEYEDVLTPDEIFQYLNYNNPEDAWDYLQNNPQVDDYFQELITETCFKPILDYAITRRGQIKISTCPTDVVMNVIRAYSYDREDEIPILLEQLFIAGRYDILVEFEEIFGFLGSDGQYFLVNLIRELSDIHYKDILLYLIAFYLDKFGYDITKLDLVSNSLEISSLYQAIRYDQPQETTNFFDYLSAIYID